MGVTGWSDIASPAAQSAHVHTSCAFTGVTATTSAAAATDAH